MATKLYSLVPKTFQLSISKQILKLWRRKRTVAVNEDGFLVFHNRYSNFTNSSFYFMLQSRKQTITTLYKQNRKKRQGHGRPRYEQTYSTITITGFKAQSTSSLSNIITWQVLSSTYSFFLGIEKFIKTKLQLFGRRVIQCNFSLPNSPNDFLDYIQFINDIFFLVKKILLDFVCFSVKLFLI